MSTTELFVEHLIAGALSLLWIAIIILTITGFDVAILEKILEYEALISIIGIAVMYPLGIFTDNLADYLLKKRNNKIRARHYLEKDGINIAKLLIQLKDDNISNYFNYSRMRLRIARSAVLNFSLLTIALNGFFLVRGNEIPQINKWYAIFTILVSGGLMTLYAFWNWNNIANNYHKATTRLWNEIIVKKPSNTD